MYDSPHSAQVRITVVSSTKWSCVRVFCGVSAGFFERALVREDLRENSEGFEVDGVFGRVSDVRIDELDLREVLDRLGEGLPSTLSSELECACRGRLRPAIGGEDARSDCDGEEKVSGRVLLRDAYVRLTAGGMMMIGIRGEVSR